MRRGSRDLCKGSDGDDAADCGQSPEAAVAAASGRKVAPRRAKFKFHKIQRLDDDDDEDNDNDNDNDGGDDDDNDDDENDNDNGSDVDVDKADEDENDESGEKANANEDDDEDDDDDNDDDDAANADDDDNDNDDDGDDDGEDNDDDDETDADAAEEQPSLLHRVMSIFTSDAEEEQAAENAKESPFQLSNIINWLQSLTEQASDAAPKGKKEKQKAQKQLAPKPEIDWLTYLKRWPFNSIFPEPPPAPATRRSAAKAKGSSTASKAQTATKRSHPSPSQSEEYLELLIHSLPAFFGNVSEAKSGECHQQLELLHRQLRAHKLWTFQSKPPLPPHSLSVSFSFPFPLQCSMQPARSELDCCAATLISLVTLPNARESPPA